MGRRKVEIKKIENKNSRQVTFSKRRSGLMKKARELSVLCDVDVAVLIFSCRGKPYDFCSTNSLAKILHRYQSYMEVEGEDCTRVHAETYNSGENSLLTIRKLLESVERVRDEQDVDELNLNDLVHLEEQLEYALSQTRSRKTHLMMQSIAGLREMEKMLREENKTLHDKIAVSAPDERRNGINWELARQQQVGVGHVNYILWLYSASLIVEARLLDFNTTFCPVQPVMGDTAI